MTIWRRASFWVITLVACLVTACGGTGAPTTAPGAPAATSAAVTAAPGGATPAPAASAPTTGGMAIDACSLLTDAEIKSATGFSPIRKTAGPQMGVFNAGCEWELDNDGAAPWSITIGLNASGGRSFYDKYIAPPVGEGEVIDGVGDDALQSDIGEVTAVKGDTIFSVLYIEFPTRDEVAVPLAKAIAAKL